MWGKLSEIYIRGACVLSPGFCYLSGVDAHIQKDSVVKGSVMGIFYAWVWPLSLPVAYLKLKHIL